MNIVKNIGLVAHDSLKNDLVAWVEANAEKLCQHNLICTGTTGTMINKMFAEKYPDKVINMSILKSGPLGGDQQLGALIADQKIDFLVFLTDPMTPQPHDVDVKALIRVAVIYNILLACTLSTAEFIVNSTLFNTPYNQKVKDYSSYIKRELNKN